MSINASEEWKKHALHPEKPDTGENEETLAPAEHSPAAPDAAYADEAPMVQSGTGIGEGDQGNLPGTGSLDAPAAAPNLGGSTTDTIGGPGTTRI